MRIHRLTLQAIGPFPGRHTVDLDALSASGLFLLEGPTGAGKSTLIDAIVFALYGVVADADSSSDRLPSHHAAPGVEPFVELVMSTGAGVFRVWRSPAHQRPKRGGGFTPQRARAKLWRLARPDQDGGDPVSAHVQEVGSELRRIVVLDRAQFTQTVVLPQGQFASFLRARPEDRRTVLQEVFGTAVYERLQRQLAEDARRERGRLDAARAGTVTAARAFASAAGLVETDAAAVVGAAEDGDAATLTRAADEAVGAHECRASAAEADRDAAADTERVAREHLRDQRELAAALARRGALLAEQAALAAAEPAVTTAAERLDRARRAATAVSAVAAREQAGERAAAAAASHRDLLGATAAGPDADLADESVDLTAAHEAATAAAGALAELVTLEEGLPARADALARARAALGRDAEHLEALAVALAVRPAGRAAREDALGELRGAGAERARAEAAVAAAGRVLTAARAVEDRTRELTAAQTELATAARTAEQRADVERAARRAWVAGMAGALAAGLADGDPCPVCGAAEHPVPAPASPGTSTADVEAAAAARETAERTLTELGARVAALRERLAAADDGAGGRDVPAAQAELAAAEEAVRAATDAIVRSAELTAELAEFDAETARLTDAHATAAAAHAAGTERVAGQAAQLAADTERCAAGRAGAPSVAEWARRLTARAETARRLQDAARERRAADAALADAEERLTAALAAAGLPDAAAVRAGTLPAADQAALERRVQQHRSALARVADGLAEPAVAGLTGAETADVPAADAAHATALQALTAASAAAREARVRAEQCAAAADRLRTALAESAELTSRAAPVLRAAALATAGDGNTISTTLATYVLLRRFEDVVAAANDRLTVVSDGRYALERIDEREGGQRSPRAGLGLQVRDHQTETARDPRTLSGGETFYVSLCLALGLADVVRAEAGGVELGTLFIDEGFGSLDPVTLDAVMAELGRLRDGGRAVGIVSHVADLKDRIAERVAVRRLPGGGSSLTVHC